jgi:hypothetical protein
VVLAIVAVHLGLVRLGGGHSLAGVVLQGRIWGWGWLGDDVAGLRRACEGASARVDRRRGELRGRGVVLVRGGVVGVTVAIVVVVVCLLGSMVVLLAIVRCKLRGREGRRASWLAERVRVPDTSVNAATTTTAAAAAASAAAAVVGVGLVVGRARPSKDVLVRGVARLGRGWGLRSGTRSASLVHLGRRRGVWRGRAKG